MLKEVELPEVEFTIQDGIFIKQLLLASKGTFVPQHSHKYEHASMLASGSIRVWQDDELKGDFKAPIPISIPAGCKHTFMSLEDNTVVYCIHRTDRFDDVEIKEHHETVRETIIEEGIKCLSE
jgi:uncharacterized RmlC-like cupin family protein